jgi:hypothetical protein
MPDLIVLVLAIGFCMFVGNLEEHEHEYDLRIFEKINPER